MVEDQVEYTGEQEVADAAGHEVGSEQTQQADAVNSEQSRRAEPDDVVPVSALQAERAHRQQLQEQMKMLQDHIALIQANQQSGAKSAPESTVNDDDILTVGEAKKYLSQMQQNYQMSVEELRVQQKYSDYNEVISSYLPAVVNKNPALKATLTNDPNRYELAYFLAKNSDEYREANKRSKKSAEAQRMVENSNRAGNLSSVGSAAPKSQVSAYKNMSDEDFMRLANKNLGYV